MNYLFKQCKCKQLILFLSGLLLCIFFIISFNKQFQLWGQIKDYYFIRLEARESTPKLLHEGRVGSSNAIHSKRSFGNMEICELMTELPREERAAFPSILCFVQNIYQENLQPYVHSPRYILVYPLIKIFKLDLQNCDTFFTYFCCFLISIFSLLGARAACLLEGSENNFTYYYFGSLILFAILSLFMNGRLIYAFLGGACLLYGQVQWIVKNNSTSLCLYSFIAVFLSNVSGGTFLVTFVSCLLFLLLSQVFSRYLWGFLVAFIPIAGTYVLKNFFYFNNSIWGLLSHGYGEGITDVYEYNHALGIALLSVLVTVAFVLFYYVRAISKKFPQFSPFLLYAYVALVFGVFGWSTFSLGICVFLILGPYLLLMLYHHYKTKYRF